MKWLLNERFWDISFLILVNWRGSAGPGMFCHHFLHSTSTHAFHLHTFIYELEIGVPRWILNQWCLSLPLVGCYTAMMRTVPGGLSPHSSLTFYNKSMKYLHLQFLREYTSYLFQRDQSQEKVSRILFLASLPIHLLITLKQTMINLYKILNTCLLRHHNSWL